MRLNEIRKQPTTTSEMVRDVGETDPRIHESVFRSYHIVDKAIKLCQQKVPHEVIIEIIEDLKNSYNTRPRLGEDDLENAIKVNDV